MQGWGPELCTRRPDITMAMVDTFLTNMYGGARADFVYTVTRDFVRACQTPILVLPDDVPGHPYAVAMETVHLAPNAQVSLYPWKDTPDRIPLAVRHIRTFLRAHQPVPVAHWSRWGGTVERRQPILLEDGTSPPSVGSLALTSITSSFGLA